MAVEGGVSRDHTMLTSSFSCCSRAMRSVSSFSRARIFSISAGQIVAAAPASQPRDQRHGGEEGAGWAATHCTGHARGRRGVRTLIFCQKGRTHVV